MDEFINEAVSAKPQAFVLTLTVGKKAKINMKTSTGK